MQDCSCSIFTNLSQREVELSAVLSLNSTRIRELAQIYLSVFTNLWHICWGQICANPFFLPVIMTVLCKSNESDVRRDFARTLANFRWMTRNFAEIFAKFRVYVSEISVERDFTGAKICGCESSEKRNFADKSLWCKQTESNANTQACIALNRYTVGSLHSIASIAGIVHHSALCDKFANEFRSTSDFIA